jgi:hypothetical protein
METLDLKQAADYLKMHWQTLREQAKSGQVPGAKIGKQWVFIQDDLVTHIRSKYASARSRSQVQRIGESLCYTSDQALSSTGVDSRHQTDKEYSNLLKR